MSTATAELSITRTGAYLAVRHADVVCVNVRLPHDAEPADAARGALAAVGWTLVGDWRQTFGGVRAAVFEAAVEMNPDNPEGGAR